MPDNSTLHESLFSNNDPKHVGNYSLTRLLGRGSSAKVYLAHNLLTHQSMAIKCFRKLPIKSLSLHIKREISILRLLHHPHIIRLHEVLASRNNIYLVLDLLKGGDLFSLLSSSGRLSESLSRRFFHQLLSALSYCHSRNVFHRDLKLENLLLDENNLLKVSDFGLSAIPDQIQQDGLFHTVCGTPAYVAPEILSKKGYGAAAADVWSCGVILFALVAGYLPFNDANLAVMYRKIYRGEFRFPEWMSGEIRDLIGRMLEKNPEKRITVEEIKEHSWMEDCVMEVEKGEEMGKKSKAEAVDEEKREINAFDIIGFSSGADLSGLFGEGERERFVLKERPEKVLGRVEEKGRKEGMEVSRKGEKGRVGVVVRGQGGNLVVGMEVYRLSRDLTVFEVQRGEGKGIWEGEFWMENGEGDRLKPVVGSVDLLKVNG